MSASILRSDVTGADYVSSQFCLAVSGFKAAGKIVADLFSPSYSTPTLHILGRTDVVVIEEKSKTLLDMSTNKRVEWHDGGKSYSPSTTAHQLMACSRPLCSDPTTLACVYARLFDETRW